MKISNEDYKGFNDYFTAGDKSLFLSALLFALILTPIFLSAEKCYGNTLLKPFPIPVNGLTERKVPEKPFCTVIEEGFYTDVIIVKFVEGSAVRLRDGRLTSPEDIGDLQNVVAAYPGLGIERVFSRSEQDLENERQRGQELSGMELADLNLFYKFKIDTKTTHPEALINTLNALSIVEIAYPEGIARPMAVCSYPQNLVSLQGYLETAPQGIDAWWGWQYNRGNEIKVVHVEAAWNFQHEDLSISGADLLGGVESTDLTWLNHGTASLGEIIGRNNSFGVTGIASDADIAMVSIYDSFGNQNVPDAINVASSNIGVGDIIFIELGKKGPVSGLVCDPACSPCPQYPGDPNSQFEYVSTDYFQAEFDAVRAATANGRIVVEAAGNGQMDLDNAAYGGRFNRGVTDSGAILVGAGTSTTPHSPICWSNYGSRVDVQGWGKNVMTTGYGNYCTNGVDRNQDYTYFSGTSAATPIVAGTAALIQSYQRNYKGRNLGPYTMRQLLSCPEPNTDQPQSERHIGPLPNLANILLQDPPTNTSTTPSTGSQNAGTAQTFTTIFVDEDGGNNLKNSYFMIRSSLASLSNAIVGYYNREENKLYLGNDAGNYFVLCGSVPCTCTPGTYAFISNSQGILNCFQTSVSVLGDNLTVN